MDLIDRQAAIDALAKFVPYVIDDVSTESYTNGLTDAYNLICQLPSAQPEIIRCKECKWYGRADKRRFYRGMDCLQKRIDTIIPDKDFCSRAERRTDD